MPPSSSWFSPHRRLSRGRSLEYYEDVYGERNPDEEAQGVHLIDSGSDAESIAECNQRASKSSIRSSEWQRSYSPSQASDYDSSVDDDAQEASKLHRKVHSNPPIGAFGEDGDISKPIDLASPSPTQSSEDVQDVPASIERYHSPGPSKHRFTGTKHRQFGLFTTSPFSDTTNSAGTARKGPERQRKTYRAITSPTKQEKKRYNLRGIERVNYAENSDSIARVEREEEAKKPKPVVRSKAARKSAWGEMGLNPPGRSSRKGRRRTIRKTNWLITDHEKGRENSTSRNDLDETQRNIPMEDGREEKYRILEMVYID